MPYDDKAIPPLKADTDLDLDVYKPYLGEWSVTDAEADEFLRTLWSIMCAFVDLGWGVDSIHFALPELAEISSPDSASELSSPDHHTIKQRAKAAFAKPSSLGDS